MRTKNGSKLADNLSSFGQCQRVSYEEVSLHAEVNVEEMLRVTVLLHTLVNRSLGQIWETN